MLNFTATVLVYLSIVLLSPHLSPQGGAPKILAFQCSQSATTREHLMREAEKKRYTIRRVEFNGHTYTRDETLRSRMRYMQEGELFSRRKLVTSLRSVSRLKSEIYPVRLGDVVIQLNRPEQLVDMIICFKPKRL